MRHSGKIAILDKIFLARLDAATYQQLVDVAEHQQLSKAALVRTALAEYFSRGKEPQITEPQQRN